MTNLFNSSDMWLQAESLEDKSLRTSNIHGILTKLDALKRNPYSSSSSSSSENNIINNEPSIPILNGYSGVEIFSKEVKSCDFVCMYLDHEVIVTNTEERQMTIRLWDGSTAGTTTNVDPKIVNYSIKCALKYAEATNIPQLNSKTADILQILQQDVSNVANANELIGCPLMVVVTDSIVIDMLSVGLMPGTWLRIRNLHLHYSGAMSTIQIDTHVCTLRPYFRYDSYSSSLLILATILYIYM